jgi:hypothetical protein
LPVTQNPSPNRSAPAMTYRVTDLIVNL